MADPHADFRQLHSPVNALDEIFCVSFFRGLPPTDVLRRFAPADERGEEMLLQELEVIVEEFVMETDGGDGGGYIGVVQASGWSVALELSGWYAVLEECYTDLSRGCEMVAVSRHDYAYHRFVYAADGEAVTEFMPRELPRKWGSDPGRLNQAMRKLGIPTDPVDDDSGDQYGNGIGHAFALAAEVTGVPFTWELLDFPLLVGPIDPRFH